MAEATPDWAAYSRDRMVAGPFENQILYAMCQANPRHSDPYVTAGKITAIGRIYAAAPERGAGFGREPYPLAYAIALRLARSPLDGKLEAVAFNVRFHEANRTQVIEAHQILVDEVAAATSEWSSAAGDLNWRPRNQASFASKYLHFHRPNAFPIMDSYAKAGLTCVGVKGPFHTYKQFCDGIARHIDIEDPKWTLRSIDTALVDRGRKHSDRSVPNCSICNVKFVKRPNGTILADTKVSEDL